MFLKKGIRESRLEGCCGGDGGIELLLLESESEPNEVSDPVCDKIGSVFGMSPKYSSANLTASLC